MQVLSLIIIGILITGGYKTQLNSTAEIYFPSTNTGCSLPDLPEVRSGHTQDGDLACGGGGYGGSEAGRSCVKWENGGWSRSYDLGNITRGGHVSWATASGVYLIGGYGNSNQHFTSTMVKENGAVEKGFDLKYTTKLKTSFIFLNLPFLAYFYKLTGMSQTYYHYHF